MKQTDYTKKRIILYLRFNRETYPKVYEFEHTEENETTLRNFKALLELNKIKKDLEIDYKIISSITLKEFLIKANSIYDIEIIYRDLRVNTTVNQVIDLISPNLLNMRISNVEEDFQYINQAQFGGKYKVTLWG